MRHTKKSISRKLLPGKNPNYSLGAGFPVIGLHDCRHTAASLMLSNGIPMSVVARILGHSRPSITLDIYSHLYSENLGEAARLMDKLVSPPIRVSFPREMASRVSSDEISNSSAP